jgi:hypothetical protein
MRWKNIHILGVLGALFFAFACLMVVVEGPWIDGFHVLLIWLACGFWRYGEGITDPYNKQQAFIAGGVFGAMGFLGLQPILKPIIDTERGFVVMFYFGVLTLLFLRLGFYAFKQGTYLLLLTMTPSQIGKFFLFQPPKQVREHTRG